MTWLRNPESLLNLHDLVCKRDERRLFEPVSLAVSDGDCIELLGPNGAGKTTMLRTLAGIHGQYEGAFTCTDFIYQGHRAGLDELMTPLENLAWYGALEGVNLSEADLRDALTEVGMAAMALTPCQRLSQGQQRRVAMARWLLSQAKTWLLDEPYTSLDRAGQDLLNAVLAGHCRQGGVVLAATHVSLQVAMLRSVEILPVEANA